MQATSPFALHNSSKRTALVPLTVQHSVLVRKTQLHFSYYLLVLRTCVVKVEAKHSTTYGLFSPSYLAGVGYGLYHRSILLRDSISVIICTCKRKYLRVLVYCKENTSTTIIC